MHFVLVQDQSSSDCLDRCTQVARSLHMKLNSLGYSVSLLENALSDTTCGPSSLSTSLRRPQSPTFCPTADTTRCDYATDQRLHYDATTQETPHYDSTCGRTGRFFDGNNNNAKANTFTNRDTRRSDVMSSSYSSTGESVDERTHSHSDGSKSPSAGILVILTTHSVPPTTSGNHRMHRWSIQGVNCLVSTSNSSKRIAKILWTAISHLESTFSPYSLPWPPLTSNMDVKETARAEVV